jgi:hypothetical protein
MRLDLLLHARDLGVEGGKDRHLRAHGGRVGGRHRGRLGQLLCAQRRPDRLGLVGGVVAAGTLERGGDLRGGQPRRRDRIGRPAQKLQRLGGRELGEGLQRGGEELPQRHPQPQGVPGPLPQQRLVGAGDHLGRLGQVAVAGDRPQLVPVGAHHVGQGVRVGGVALGARTLCRSR